MMQTNGTWGPVAATWAYPTLGAWARSQRIAVGVLLLGLIQGLVYIAVVPPWQHYDEPTHFEYAWLIANRGRLPLPGETDQLMRREVAASMVAHNFYWNVPKPDLLTDKGVIEIGISELVHPPAYYLLVSLPLRAARYLDITTQLYIARMVSVGLFVLTIGIALGLMRDLLPHCHVLRWAVPLTLVLLPPFTDVMTSVNNDVGAVVVFSLFLWLSVRTIRYGLAWRRVLLLCGSAALCIATKNTAAVALVLAPAALLLAVSSQRAWGLRSLASLTLAAFVVLLFMTLGWGDAAVWYRGTSGKSQAAKTRVQTATAPHGRHAFVLQSTASVASPQLRTPLLPAGIKRVRGQMVTVGGWLWSKGPTDGASLSLTHSLPGGQRGVLSAHPVKVTASPRFIAWTISIPVETEGLQYTVSVNHDSAVGEDTEVYLDGAILAEGVYPTIVAPTFEDFEGHRGRWDGRPFTNLVRNGSAERASPRLRPWAENLVVSYARRSPSLVVSSLFDVERSGPILAAGAARLLFSFFGTFGWAHVNVDGTWIYLFVIIALGTLIGCIRQLPRLALADRGDLAPSLLFLGLAGVLVWTNALLRILPFLDGAFMFPVARYGFPAVFPAVLAIVGGWWTMPPRRFSRISAVVVGVALLGLDLVALSTISSFYKA